MLQASIAAEAVAAADVEDCCAHLGERPQAAKNQVSEDDISGFAGLVSSQRPG
jgi:hypothetical protein